MPTLYKAKISIYNKKYKAFRMPHVCACVRESVSVHASVSGGEDRACVAVHIMSACKSFFE